MALLAAQLTSSARATYGLTGAVIGLSYGLRAIGDVSAPALSWLSPIGWYQAMHAFSGLRWWPALLPGRGAVALAAAAGYAVFDRRDFGAGCSRPAPGPAGPGEGLQSGLGSRGACSGRRSWAGPSDSRWAACRSASWGTTSTLVGDSDLSQELILAVGGSVVDAFYAMLVAMLAAIAGGFAISSALRPYAEGGGRPPRAAGRHGPAPVPMAAPGTWR